MVGNGTANCIASWSGMSVIGVKGASLFIPMYKLINACIPINNLTPPYQGTNVSNR